MIDRDVRITIMRDASVHWQARGTALHLPTGHSVEFRESWDGYSDKADALAKLREMVNRTP